MTDTAPISSTIRDLEAQIEQARREEQAELDRKAREAKEREVDYRRRRLAAYDLAATAKQTRAAELAFREALANDPVFSAFAEAQAAKWREHRARQTAYDDAAFIARHDGTDMPASPGMGTPAPLSADALINAVSNLVAERVQEFTDQIDSEYAAAIYGDNLSREQIIAAEREAVELRRHQRAQHVAAGSIDVTGMTDAERAERGLPPGSSRSVRGN